MQLWATVFIVVLALGLALVITSVSTTDDSIRDLVARQPGFRYGLLAVLVGFGGYVLDTERVLRRLSAHVTEAEIAAATDRARLEWLATLDQAKSDAVSALHAAMSRALTGVAALVADLDGEHPVVRALASEARRARGDLERILDDHDSAMVQLAQITEAPAESLTV